jgi:CheY-like chemotaxis protein
MNSKAILLVEDNDDDVKLTIRALEKNNIMNEVIVVGDGQEALDWLFIQGKHAARNPEISPSVVLLDLKLPKIGGIDVLKTIRADERTKNLPVIIFTSSKEEQDIIDSYSLGCNAYVRKPVSFEEFLEAVKQLGISIFLIDELPPESASQLFTIFIKK